MAFGAVLERGNGFTIYDSAANADFRRRQDIIDRKANTQTFSTTSTMGGGGRGGISGGNGIDYAGNAAFSLRERMANADFERQSTAFAAKKAAANQAAANNYAQNAALQAMRSAAAIAQTKQQMEGQSRLQREGADQRSQIQKEGADQREAAKAGDRSAAMKAIAEMIAKRRAGMR